MEKPVIISVRGTQQSNPEEKEDVMELVTQGVLSGSQEEGYVLSYQESELTGLEGTTTTFLVEKDKITLRREGSINSEMIFQVGQRHLCLYETPYGGFMLGVNTQRAWSDLDQSGGSLSIRYIMEVENERVGENSFEIHVSEPTPSSPVVSQ